MSSNARFRGPEQQIRSRRENRTRADNSPTGNRSSSQNRRLRDLNKELTEIAARVDEVSNQKQAAHALSEERAALVLDNAELESQCKAIEDDLKHYKEMLYEKNERIVQLKETIALEESRLINLRRREEESDHLWMRNCDTNSYLAHRFKEDMRILSEMLDSLYSNESVLMQQKKERQLEVAECKQSLAEVEKENKRFDCEIIELNREREQLQREIKYLDGSVTESRIKADELGLKQTENIDLMKEAGIDYERAIEKLHQMEESWLELKKENAQLRQDLIETQSQRWTE